MGARRLLWVESTEIGLASSCKASGALGSELSTMKNRHMSAVLRPSFAPDFPFSALLYTAQVARKHPSLVKARGKHAIAVAPLVEPRSSSHMLALTSSPAPITRSMDFRA